MGVDSEGDDDVHHHSASTKNSYSTSATIKIQFSVFSRSLTVQILQDLDSSLNLYMLVPEHRLQTPVQTSLTVKDSHSRFPGSPRKQEAGCSLSQIDWIETVAVLSYKLRNQMLSSTDSADKVGKWFCSVIILGQDAIVELTVLVKTSWHVGHACNTYFYLCCSNRTMFPDK